MAQGRGGHRKKNSKHHPAEKDANVRREPHEDGEKGNEKGRAEGTYRQPVTA
jgi:hypothetical protein